MTLPLYLTFDGGNGASREKEAYGSYVIYNHAGALLANPRVSFGTGFTNNEAEYKTLIAALDWIRWYVSSFHAALRDHDLHIAGDSELVRNQIGTYIKVRSATQTIQWQGWQVKAKHLLPLRDQARELLAMYNTFSYEHKPRKEIVKIFGH